MNGQQQGYSELRAEWLKLRGCLFDPNTGLPALPAIIEDVRRRVEDGDVVGIVYLDLSSEQHLEAVHGWQIYDRLLQQVASRLKEFREARLSERDLVAVLGIRGDEFLLFVGSPAQQGFDERRLTHMQKKVVSYVDEGLRSQVGGEVPVGPTIVSGSGLVHPHPTVRIERSIYQCVSEVKAACLRQRARQHGLRLNELRRILATQEILIRYQPIVRLGDGLILGFEALSSGPAGDIFQSPELLFSFAEETEQLLELERLCRLRSIRGAAGRVGPQKLFLNCSPQGLVDPELISGPLLEEVEAAGLEPSDIVFEVTERAAITEWKEFRTIVSELRRCGFAVAIDDVGAGYSSLHRVVETEPDYLKFDISLVRDIHLSPIKRNLLETLVVLAEKIRAQVIAEGVETREEFQELRGVGVPYAQGYFFAAPGPLPERLSIPLPPNGSGSRPLKGP